jgi:hypothetical protein
VPIASAQLPDQLKFVIGSKADFDWSVALLSKHPTPAEVLFSPVFEAVEPMQLAQWILDGQLNERLQRDNHAINPYSKQYFDKASNRYVIKIKISGIGENNFNISTDKNNLIIKAKQSSKSDTKRANEESKTCATFFFYWMVIFLV